MTAGSLTTVATPAAAATTWLQVSAGNTHTCGITSARDLWCWGNNSHGQLGTGDTTRRLTPTRVGARGIWASVSAGSYHTCALDRDGTRYCWGSNASGQLGYDDTTDRRTPTAADSTWTMISAGVNHTCGIQTNRRAYCWGDDWAGQLGDGTAGEDQPSVQRVQFDGRWSSISAGELATCGTDSEGTRYCWGTNASDALGLDRNDGYIPLPTTWGNGTWRTVETGFVNGCGVSQGRRLYCWGYNSQGQLGVGDRQSRSEPTQVSDEYVSGNKWAQVSMGVYHTCGLRTDGIGYCWGDNAYGQLGIPPNRYPNVTVPPIVPIDGMDISGRPKPIQTWSSLSASGTHTCGIRTDGRLFCWGRNNHGQLGDGTTTNRFYPSEVA